MYAGQCPASVQWINGHESNHSRVRSTSQWTCFTVHPNNVNVSTSQPVHSRHLLQQQPSVHAYTNDEASFFLTGRGRDGLRWNDRAPETDGDARVSGGHQNERHEVECDDQEQLVGDLWTDKTYRRTKMEDNVKSLSIIMMKTNTD